jgi:hypothetical protein
VLTENVLEPFVRKPDVLIAVVAKETLHGASNTGSQSD